ncbi:hypothetical protein AOL_s00076g278 [Orbilia oligospora ATCC 24927]|uniref:Purine nucleoside permease n=1 Tax=Arthrobotrys oligospora (strain ATCC 24927 / CBS 115.81 / DSM 1491) TaxID=756982 RepID=G1X9H1_ARTOA|nr:hypothetical protein AOL_s00076g278 [Orbilia oligospora ATCC 24927]EGX50203.1 hypothetical protein AOL_s00076g278 [Orbilia oligospora ATCC 24927]
MTIRSIIPPNGLPKYRSDRYVPRNRAQERHVIRQRGNAPLGRSDGSSDIIKPKVMIVAIFSLEADVFLNNYTPTLYGLNVTVPGLSPRYPEVYCTTTGEVCHITTAEAEINAAASMSALVYSRMFDLSETYFFIGGISGINPNYGTTGTVTFPRFAVQLGLQYEIDSGQLPRGGGLDFGSGFFTQRTKEFKNNIYPGVIYGTEVFGLNEALRKRVFLATTGVKLVDTEAARYRRLYSIPAARTPPGVTLCDTGTSDTWWTGSVLAGVFGNLTVLLTNGTGEYCTTQQEDNATLAVLVRAAAANLVDFARVIILRTGSDFDRAPPGIDELYHLLQAPQGGFAGAIANIYVAGVRVVNDIVSHWDEVYKAGVKPTNYIGDILNTLGSPYGHAPDIGVEDQFVVLVRS